MTTQPLTFREAAAFLLLRLGLLSYCAAWVGGFVWVVG